MYCYFAATSSDKLAALVFNQNTNERHNVSLKVYNALTGQLLKKFDLELHALVMGGTSKCLFM
jgi:hypothetical protein